jgi:hypothetical protein
MRSKGARRDAADAENTAKNDEHSGHDADAEVPNALRALHSLARWSRKR